MEGRGEEEEHAEDSVAGCGRRAAAVVVGDKGEVREEGEEGLEKG